MSLQVKVRHALGERLIELPERPVDQPVVVGRSSTSDVQVPSITVAQRHCVLFVHEGRWVLQDLGGTSGTFVGGNKADGPVLLRVGDVITLGPDANAPTIQIDPAGVAQGNKGKPAAGIAAPPAAPVVPPTPQVPAGIVPEASTYAYGGPTQVPATAPAPAAWPQQSPAPAEYPTDAAAAGSDVVPWAADVGTTRYYTRRRRADYSLPIAIFITLLLVGGAAYYTRPYWRQTAQVTQPAVGSAPAPVASQPTTQPEQDTSHFPQSMFDKAEARRRAAGATRPTTAAVVPAPQPAPPPEGADGEMDPDATADATHEDAADAVPPQDEGPAAAPAPADNPAWRQVQTARYSPDEAGAILKFDDYARSNPGQSAADLEAYTEKAMDRIWFERVEQLCKRREELKAKIAEADKDLAAETNEAYKKRVLLPLKGEYGKQLQSVDEELTENMRYAGASAPNLLDEVELEGLRKQRDPALYSTWKSRVLTHIRRTHGELPWVSGKTN